MENGDDFIKLRDKIERKDLDVILKGGLVVTAPYGSLLALRASLKEQYGVDTIYMMCSSAPLYLVHWNDLSQKKQREIEAGKNKL